MIVEQQGIEYTVSPLDGWHSRLYQSLSVDVLHILAFDCGVKESNFEDLINNIPATLLHTYEYFVKFCLTTKASKGDFQNYNIMQLNFIPAKYRKWLDLFNQDGFYERWLEAYQYENKEEPDQKKEPIGA